MGLVIFRVIYVLGSCLLICNKPDTSAEFFKGLLILTAGLTYDYYSIYTIGKENNMRYQIWLGRIGTCLAASFFAIAIFGLVDILQLTFSSKGILLENGPKLMIFFAVEFNIFLRNMLLVFIFLVGFEVFGGHKRKLLPEINQVAIEKVKS